MVHEVRRIILSEQELHSAMESYQRITPTFLPQGSIEGCKSADNNDVHITLKTSSGDPAQTTTVKMSCDDILKPLIRFCIENNIMLPRDGQKIVRLTNGEIALCVTLNLDIDLAEHIKPLQLAQINEVIKTAKATKS